jgi:hypothetical protein
LFYFLSILISEWAELRSILTEIPYMRWCSKYESLRNCSREWIEPKTSFSEISFEWNQIETKLSTFRRCLFQKRLSKFWLLLTKLKFEFIEIYWERKVQCFRYTSLSLLLLWSSIFKTRNLSEWSKKYFQNILEYPINQIFQHVVCERIWLEHIFILAD